jgi:hypothetical protein
MHLGQYLILLSKSGIDPKHKTFIFIWNYLLTEFLNLRSYAVIVMCQPNLKTKLVQFIIHFYFESAVCGHLPTPLATVRPVGCTPVILYCTCIEAAI